MCVLVFTCMFMIFKKYRWDKWRVDIRNELGKREGEKRKTSIYRMQVFKINRAATSNERPFFKRNWVHQHNFWHIFSLLLFLLIISPYFEQRDQFSLFSFVQHDTARMILVLLIFACFVYDSIGRLMDIIYLAAWENILANRMRTRRASCFSPLLYATRYNAGSVNHLAMNSKV